MRWRFASVLGALALAVFMLVLLLISRNQQERDLAELRREVAALARSDPREPAAPEVAHLSSWVEPTRQVPGPRLLPPSRDADGSSTAEASAPIPTSRERREGLEAAFYGDNVAAADWGGMSRAAALERARVSLPAGSELESFDCRASMCRIETSHIDRQQYTEFVEKAFLSMDSHLWNAPAFVTRRWDEETPGGRWLMVAYLAQPGAKLPE